MSANPNIDPREQPPVRAHIAEQPSRVAPLVQIKHGAVRLDGRTIWHDVDLDVYPGEFIAILGPNGAGKSTLIKVILGLAPLSAGSVTVEGVRPERGRRVVGYLPQRRNFGTEVRVRGRDLVRLGLDGTRWGVPLGWLRRMFQRRKVESERARVQRVIDMVGAGALADRPIGELSGGEQQRLLIAQALVTEPRLLLLDEPLDSLDLPSQQAVSEVIRDVSLETGAAVMLVAHDVNPLLPFVDRLIYVAGGRVAIGRPEDVITTETLSELYGAPVEVFRAGDGRLVVVGQPEGVPCKDHPEHEVAARPVKV